MMAGGAAEGWSEAGWGGRGSQEAEEEGANSELERVKGTVEDGARRPMVEGRRMRLASVEDATYCVRARGGGETRWLRSWWGASSRWGRREAAVDTSREDELRRVPRRRAAR